MIGIKGGPKASLIGDWGISKSPVIAWMREVLDGRGEVWWGFWMVSAIVNRIVHLNFFPSIVSWRRKEDAAKPDRGCPCFHKGVKDTHPWATQHIIKWVMGLVVGAVLAVEPAGVRVRGGTY